MLADVPLNANPPHHLRHQGEVTEEGAAVALSPVHHRSQAMLATVTKYQEEAGPNLVQRKRSV